MPITLSPVHNQPAGGAYFTLMDGKGVIITFEFPTRAAADTAHAHMADMLAAGTATPGR